MPKKLTNQDKLAIQNGLKTKTISELSLELDVKEKVIEDYLDNLFATVAELEKNRKEAAKEAEDRTAGAAIITKTLGKKIGGVAVMTEAASAIADGVGKTTIHNASVVGVINPNKK